MNIVLGKLLVSGDSRSRTNTVVLMLPKHITAAGYLSVPVEAYIPNPLHCFNCQKYGHSSRACKSTALCMKCGEGGHEGAKSNNHQKCVNGELSSVVRKSAYRWQQRSPVPAACCASLATFVYVTRACNFEVFLQRLQCRHP